MEENIRLKFHGGKYMSLIPVFVFLAFGVYLLLVLGAFDLSALAMAGFVGLLIGAAFCKNYDKYWDEVLKEVATPSNINIIFIFFVIGMFSALMKASGLSSGFVWIANKLGWEGGAFVALSFIAASIISSATGSSMGTLFTTMPIFYPAGVMLGGNPAFVAGAIFSGCLLGDNLAPISDTTIASASSQLFKNGKPADIGGVVKHKATYAAVAGIISVIVYAIFGGRGGVYQGGSVEAVADPTSLVMLIPVIVMLFVSTKSKNIFKGISVGLVLGTVIGLAVGLFSASDIVSYNTETGAMTGYLVTGVSDMLSIVALIISIYGIVGVLNAAGMMDHLVNTILSSKLARSPAGAEIAIILSASVGTFMLGGIGTPAIIVLGSLTNRIGSAKNIHPYRRANLLCCSSNSLPTIIPFMSSTLFIISSMTGLSPLDVALTTTYAYALYFLMVFTAITGWTRMYEEE